MPTTRYIIVCEGQSERAYLKRLQGFLDTLELPPKTFATPLKFIVTDQQIVGGGSIKKITDCYTKTRKKNKNALIQIWADFDLYHRNDKQCAEHYAVKASGIPDFHFSFHNFEDFYALHFDGLALTEWFDFVKSTDLCDFTKPLHSVDYLRGFKRIFTGYSKGELPAHFISWASLKNLKANLAHQPKSNPHNLKGIRSFAEFLIGEIENAYPGKLGSN